MAPCAMCRDHVQKDMLEVRSDPAGGACKPAASRFERLWCEVTRWHLTVSTGDPDTVLDVLERLIALSY